MLTVNEIDQLCKKDGKLPKGSTLPEIGLYTVLSKIYELYRTEVTKIGEDEEEAEIKKAKAVEKARKMKTKAFGEYEMIIQHENLLVEEARRTTEISKILVKANKDGCPICQEMAKLFDGRQREAKE